MQTTASRLKCWQFLCLYLFTCLVCISQSKAQQHNINEYDLKVAYLYNFTKFIRWPSSSFSSPQSSFNICVKGALPTKATIEQLQRKTTRGHPLRIISTKDVESIKNCHIVYFREYERENIKRLTKTLYNDPVLTVGDHKDFALAAGVVEFSIDSNKRLQLKINHRRAKRCGISISAQLLEIASVIHHSERL